MLAPKLLDQAVDTLVVFVQVQGGRVAVKASLSNVLVGIETHLFDLLHVTEDRLGCCGVFEGAAEADSEDSFAFRTHVARWCACMNDLPPLRSCLLWRCEWCGTF